MKLKVLMYVLILCLIVVAGQKDVFSTQSDISVIINSHRVEFTEETGFPFVDENNRTMVPLRITMETAGFDVGFDVENSVAIVVTEHRRIEIPIGEDFMYVGNTRVQNDTHAIVSNGRTFLPIRAVLEAAGFTVEWHSPSSSVNAILFEWNDDLFVPFGTSSLETLVRNILNGSVVIIDGRYYSTPERMRMYLNTRVHYLSDDLNTAILPRPDRFALRDLDLSRPNEWYSLMDLSRYNIQFSHGSRVDGVFRIDVWSFRRGSIASEQLVTVLDLTNEFINADNAEGVFSGIRMRKENGNFLFNREDLIRLGILE